jgi:hypothetical protein
MPARSPAAMPNKASNITAIRTVVIAVSLVASLSRLARTAKQPRSGRVTDQRDDPYAMQC